MKTIFDREYPDEQIRDIEKWIEEILLTKDGEIKVGMYRAKIIVEIIPE